jgi:glycogen debranching enzyme
MKYTVASDFADMFEVRGFPWDGIERQISTRRFEGGVEFTYIALDGAVCRTSVTLTALQGDGSPGETDVDVVTSDSGSTTLSLQVTVAPRAQQRWILCVTPTVEAQHGAEENTAVSLENVLDDMQTAKQAISREYETWFQSVPQVTGDDTFARWYQRGLIDVRMLLTDIGHGFFPVAGVPWYAVPFGRDSLITSWQFLSAHPGIARGTLRTMAAFQGQNVDPSRDEQPGKIMHELRSGELTRTGRIPFGPYFGTIDATPLFLNLAADYLAWTGDMALIQSLLPTAERAFAWIEQYGDQDGDGFVEYFREADKGLSNQGWKDSGDSIVHKNGELAEGSIALCEVQGYVYRAYRKWTDIYRALGRDDVAERLSQSADRLQKAFLEQFWLSDENVIALALDGNKQPVASVTSNMGQVLWSGILPEDIANRVIDRLLADDMFSGYGIRTLSSLEVAYNPLSYHDGSVWPHDNSIILAGFVLYGRQDAADRLIQGLMRATHGFEFARLPELFAGFGVDEVSTPVPYPVSCSPQAWAAATPMVALQAILGLDPDVPGGKVTLRPHLPGNMQSLVARGIRIGKGVLSVALSRRDGQTAMDVIENTTGLSLEIQGAVKGVMS